MFFQSIQENFVRCFHLAIALWVPRGRIQVFDFQLMAKISVYSAIKLWLVVSYDRLRYSEPAENIPPHKLDDILVFDGGEGFRFYPFAKVVSGNQ